MHDKALPFILIASNLKNDIIRFLFAYAQSISSLNQPIGRVGVRGVSGEVVSFRERGKGLSSE